MSNSLLAKAITFAQQKHEGQTRKATALPYITHLAGVALLINLLKRSKNLEPLMCAAYLHDTLEDTNTTSEEIQKEFGDLIASLVIELTSDKNQIAKQGKTDYLQYKMVKMSSYALTLKLCDRLHNISDFPTDKTISETLDIINFLESNRKLNETQRKIISLIRDRVIYLLGQKTITL
jgi:guanosine-3',5'-bis(diphosphate) 3'-pyrophosphohydrolase